MFITLNLLPLPDDLVGTKNQWIKIWATYSKDFQIEILTRKVKEHLLGMRFADAIISAKKRDNIIKEKNYDQISSIELRLISAV